MGRVKPHPTRVTPDADVTKLAIENALHKRWPHQDFHVDPIKGSGLYSLQYSGKHSPNICEVEKTLEEAGLRCQIQQMNWCSQDHCEPMTIGLSL